MGESKKNFGDEIEHDDVDNLFKRLQLLEPPPSLISRILSSIKQLPLPTENPQSIKDELERDGPIVRNEHKEPC
jgi:hypothetical protein